MTQPNLSKNQSSRRERGADQSEIRRALELLHPAGDVFELRALGGQLPRPLSGYFNDHGKASAAAIEMERKGAEGVYVTLNAVNPALLSRANNRIAQGQKNASTADKDIPRRSWLFIDCDPVRPSGISSTDAEHRAALDKAREIAGWLGRGGFPPAILADSGNGAHLLYKLDLPSDGSGLVSRVLKTLDRIFSDGRVKVDVTTFNPARIVKLYGSLARKGDSTDERPHRRSKLLEVPNPVEYVPIGRLEEIAVFIDAQAEPQHSNSNAGGFDVRQRLAQWGLEVLREELHEGGARLVLRQCPFGEHRKEAKSAVFVGADGRLGFHCFSDDHALHGWKTLREKYEPDHAQARNGTGPRVGEGMNSPAPGRSDSATGPGDWPEPEPIGGQLAPVPEFIPDLIPAPLLAWISDVAERFQCPLDYLAPPMVVAAGMLLGRKLSIRPKARDDWREYPNLWCVVVGHPGMMKSPALNEALKPLRRIESEARARHKDEMQDQAYRQSLADASRQRIEQEIKKRTANQRQTDDLREELRKSQYSEPTERRYIVSDATVEKLAALLIENPNGFLLVRDELSGLLWRLEGEEHQSERGFYLEAWSGKEPIRTDRIGRGTSSGEAACLSVVGGTTPSTLDSFVRSVYSGARNDGMLQRFQLAVYPDPLAAFRNVDREPDGAAKARVYGLFNRLESMAADDFLANDDGEGDFYLRFEADAQQLFNGWRERLEERCRDHGEHPVLVSHLSKYRKLVPALALIFHAVAVADGDAPSAISVEALRRAIAWAEYLEAHARRIYQGALQPAETAAAVLAERIRKPHVPERFTIRDVLKKGWVGLNKREVVAAALEILEEAGHVRREPQIVGGTGRPAERFRVNPKVRE